MIRTLLAGALSLGLCAPALADKLDDIISSGTLRCAVTLDFPPIGLRDENNDPIGFDVDYCNDLAEALGVEAEIVDTPFPDRIPALISGRADVGVASTSDTLERAKTIGFTIPYVSFQNVVLTREDTGIETYEDLKGKRVGGVQGTYETLAFQEDFEEWDAGGALRTFPSQADVFLALNQRQIDATVVTSTVAAATAADDRYEGFVVKGAAPYDVDYTALITLRQEVAFLRYLDLFVNRQVRSGRYQELWEKWVGGPTPPLTVDGVYR